MKRTNSILALFALLLSAALSSSSDAVQPIDPLSDPPARGFISHTQAANWEEALISGNGTLGALVMGDPQNETIILSHERLFMPMDKAMPPVVFFEN